MRTNNVNGRRFIVIIGIYLIAKVVINTVIGGALNLGDLILSLILFGAMYTGLKLVNWGVAIIMALIVLTHLPHNISFASSSIIYLIEAALDIVCVVMLATNADIKGHFTTSWNDLPNLFK